MNNPMWNAILRWSIGQQDPDSKPSECKPMSDENKKWLSKVMKSMVVDEIGRMKLIVKMLEIPEDVSKLEEFASSEGFLKLMYKADHADDSEDSDEEEVAAPKLPEGTDAKALAGMVLEKKQNCLEELEDLVCGIDRAMDLHKIDGLVPVINTLASKHLELQWRAASVLSTAAQNNPKVQTWATEAGGVSAVCALMKRHLALQTEPTEVQHKVAFKALGAASCMIRDCPAAEAEFNKKQGLLLVTQLAVGTKSDTRTKRKALFCLPSLLTKPKAVKLLAMVNVIPGIVADLEHEDVMVREGCLKSLSAIVAVAEGKAACIKANVAETLARRLTAIEALEDPEDVDMCEEEKELVGALLGKCS